MESPPEFAWERVQADFPVNDHLIWLNNCGTTPLGRPMQAEVAAFLESYSHWGGTEGKSYPAVKASIYRRLADLLHASPDEFALIHNTAEGMNFLSHGF